MNLRFWQCTWSHGSTYPPHQRPCLGKFNVSISSGLVFTGCLFSCKLLKIFHLCVLNNFRLCPGDIILSLVNIPENVDFVCWLSHPFWLCEMWCHGLITFPRLCSVLWVCTTCGEPGPGWDLCGYLCHASAPKDLARLLQVLSMHRFKDLFPSCLCSDFLYTIWCLGSLFPVTLTIEQNF